MAIMRQNYETSEIDVGKDRKGYGKEETGVAGRFRERYRCEESEGIKRKDIVQRKVVICRKGE